MFEVQAYDLILRKMRLRRVFLIRIVLLVAIRPVHAFARISIKSSSDRRQIQAKTNHKEPKSGMKLAHLHVENALAMRNIDDDVRLSRFERDLRNAGLSNG